MNLADARRLRDEIREAGLHCTVPLGYGPDSYFARIFGTDGPLGLCHPSDWKRYQRNSRRLRKRIEKKWAAIQLTRRPRSPSPTR